MIVRMSECLRYQCQVALYEIIKRLRIRTYQIAFSRIIILILISSHRRLREIDRYYRLPARHDIIIIIILRFRIIRLADRSRRGRHSGDGFLTRIADRVFAYGPRVLAIFI